MAFVCRGHAILAVVAILAGLVWAGGTARAASLVVDVETGQVIASDAPNHLWYPASLTKMMTVYVALSEIEAVRFPEPVGEYTYTQLKFNQNLTDYDFDVRNKNYEF